MQVIQDILRGIAGLGWPETLVKAILGNESCAKTLFYENFLDKTCLTLAVSKALGYVLILGACLFKIPVILKIVNAKGGDGLNATSLYLEISAVFASLVYNIFIGSSFSTYGDLYPVIGQNLVIVALCWLWGVSGKMFGATHMVFISLLSVIFVAAIFSLPPHLHYLCASYSTIVLTISRLPQIYSNLVDKTVGVQSLFTLGLAAVGTFVKLFVVAVESTDLQIIVGAVISFALNFILVVQVAWMSVEVASESKEKKE